MFLHDQELRQALLPAMSPVREENFGSVSYDLTIRGFVTSEKDGKESAACALGPGESVFASSEEVLTVPDDCVGFVTLRNSGIRMGLSLSAPVYQPGHTTRIFVRLTNVSDALLALSRGGSVASLMLSRLDMPVEKPYRGRYENQMAFSDDKKASGRERGFRTGGFSAYPACFYPSPNGRGLTVAVPDLPGCVAHGRTLVETESRAASAAARWLARAKEKGQACPVPRSMRDVRPEKPDGFVKLVVVDRQEDADEGWPHIKPITRPEQTVRNTGKSRLSASAGLPI